MKSCRSPCFLITSVPGRSHKWKVLPRMISAPVATISRGSMPLTVPYVPTGMKAGVSTVPRGKVKRPRRAEAKHRGDDAEAVHRVTDGAVDALGALRPLSLSM